MLLAMTAPRLSGDTAAHRTKAAIRPTETAKTVPGLEDGSGRDARERAETGGSSCWTTGFSDFWRKEDRPALRAGVTAG